VEKSLLSETKGVRLTTDRGRRNVFFTNTRHGTDSMADAERATPTQRSTALRAVRTSRDAGDSVVRLFPMRDVSPRRSSYTRVVKPVFDRFAAAIGLAMFAIPMSVIAGVVLMSIGRPVLFRQQRVGIDGEVFSVLKFRTMSADRREQRLDVIADRRETHKSERDPRHTRIGRFLRRYSLDELPQLVNVVRGEMSVVGPRPELESVVADYCPGLEQRHLVKPGLTGLWQISARGDGPMHENGEWDLAYVERVSLRSDLTIIARTPSAMLGRNQGS
jgi:lipopolysaccharide/colanic/teichoic acid biosynthesis glycosyltransferase